MNDHHLTGLDGVEPPDHWADILGRTPAPTPDAASRPRRAIAVAALLLVVAALAGLIWANSSADDASVASDPTGIWGERWQLARIDVGGATIDTDLVGSGGGAIVLDATTEGQLSYEGCTQVGGEASIADGRLVGARWITTAMGCADPVEQLLRFDGAAVEVAGDRLVLTVPGENGGPSFRYELARAGSLPPEAQIRGRRWQVTELVHGNRGVTFDQGSGPVLDLRDPAEVVVEGCGRSARPGGVADGRIEVAGDRWRPGDADCEQTPASEHGATVRAIVEPGAVVRRDEHRLVVESSAGSLVAEAEVRPSAWDLFADGGQVPGTARWLVVAATDQAGARALTGEPELTASTFSGRDGPWLEATGCRAIGRLVTDIDKRGLVLRRDPGPGGPVVTCTQALMEQDVWLGELLDGEVEVRAVGDRALLSSAGGSVLLVRLE